jgi:PAS domain S-box-containing protein
MTTIAPAASLDIEPGFRSMADDAPVMIWVTQPSGYCVYLNRRWYEFTGQTESEALGFGWLETTHPEDRDHAERAFVEANGAQAPFRIEYRLRRADGQYRWAIDSAKPRFGPDGEFLGYIGSVIDINERREQEERLRHSERRFRSAVDAVAGVLWTNDSSGRMVGEQPGWARLTGQSFDAYQGYGWTEAVHPDDVQSTIDAWNAAVADKRLFEFEHRVRRADGSWGFYAVRAVPAIDETDTVREWVGVHTDITTEREAEASLRAAVAETQRVNERLRDSEARLRAVFDAVPVGIVLAEAPDGRITGGNAQVEEVFGHPVLPSPDVESYRDWIAYHPDGRRLTGEEYPLTRALRGKAERPEIEVIYQRGDGSNAWIRLIAAPVRDDDDRITGGVVACLDIDRQKRAEAELREERDRAQGYLQVAGVMLLVLDRNGRIREINRRGGEILGFADPDPLVGREWFEVAVPHSERAKVRAVFERMMQGEFEDTQFYENSVLHTDGSERLVAWHNTVLRSPEGDIIGTLSSGEDITERRRAEERERLLAHEIDHRAKNLLAVMQAVVQLTSATDPEAFRHAVSGRLGSLARTHSLLAASRWEGADLKKIVEDELAPFARSDTDHLTVDGEELQLLVPAAQALALVIHELATNSVKYGALSIPSGHLSVSWHRTGAEGKDALVVDWVETGGPPVTAPLRQGFGSKVVLSSVERQLGGSVRLDWRREGLACQLTIPSASALTSARTKPSVHQPGPEDDTIVRRDDRPLRILVLEDEALVAEQVGRILFEGGHEVVALASRLEQAFDAFYLTKPDAAVLDINIAGSRSFAFAEFLLAKSIPFLFLSAYGDTLELPETLRSAAVIDKPTAPEDLLQAVDRFCRP